MTPTFQGEMQLAGWSETHNGGCKVTFWLADSDDLEAFRTLTVRKGNTAGHRFAAVLVEIGDDEMAVEPEVKGGPLSQWLAMRLQDPEFLDWWDKWYGTLYGPDEPLDKAVEGSILAAVGVPSKRYIDSQAAEQFKAKVVRPWQSFTTAEMEE